MIYSLYNDFLFFGETSVQTACLLVKWILENGYLWHMQKLCKNDVEPAPKPKPHSRCELWAKVWWSCQIAGSRSTDHLATYRAFYYTYKDVHTLKQVNVTSSIIHYSTLHKIPKKCKMQHHWPNALCNHR